MEQTAENTGEANAQLQKIVAQQGEHIDLLKEQLALKKEQLELSERQLAILKEIFVSNGDVAVAGILQWGTRYQECC